jgi:hypothetical protein
MAVQFRKAERRKAKARVGIAGPSGSGKTLGALLLAYGLTGDWSQIGLIDTENGSGELYANTQKAGVGVGEYNVLTLTPPYTPEKYIEGIKAAEAAGFKVLIIDSLTHAWAGEGGLLDLHDKITKASKSGNSWAAWRDVTPKHNALVEAMLKSSCHIIATMRSKTEYIQTKDDKGNTVIKKVGMSPIQRDGMEYEFTIMLDVSMDHIATSSKDRTGIFDGQYITLSPDAGKSLLMWLESGTDAPPALPQASASQPIASQSQTKNQDNSNTTGGSKAPANGGNIKWDNFWKSVGGMGFDEFAVHEYAKTVFNKPDLQSLTEVITDQKQLNSFLSQLAKKKAGVA